MEHFGQPIAGAFAEDKVTQPRGNGLVLYCTHFAQELGFSLLVFPTIEFTSLF